jgi:penicillin-binding protein 2
LIGLQTGAITPETRFSCNRNIIGCHGNHTFDDLKSAIFHSCNPYFYQVYKRLIQQGKSSNIFIDSRIGLTEWRDHVRSFGFGKKLATEFNNQKAGYVPDTLFYDKWYGARRWAFSTIYSNSIGEGELGVVPIQMANLAAIIANKGHYFTPHLIKSISETGSKRDEYLVKNKTTIDSSHFGLVQDAMQLVVESNSGTAARARIKGITVCGKTGTVQNGDFKDHSVFIAFAPKENPKIAIAVYVEYAGFGGTWAAPIASLMIEKYLTDSISNEYKQQRIFDAVIYDREK